MNKYIVIPTLFITITLIILLIGSTDAKPISLLVSSSIRGNAFPIYTPKAIQHCYEEDFDDPDCLAGCPRRIALTRKLREENEDLFVVDTGGIYFGTVLYTLYGTDPFERCIEEIDYDVIALGGSDLYVGLEIARLFFMQVGIQNISADPENQISTSSSTSTADSTTPNTPSSSFDMYSQSIALPNMMFAESFLHHHQTSMKLDKDTDSQRLHDKLLAHFSATDPETLQERIIHQIQTLTYPTPQEQTSLHRSQRTTNPSYTPPKYIPVSQKKTTKPSELQQSMQQQRPQQPSQSSQPSRSPRFKHQPLHNLHHQPQQSSDPDRTGLANIISTNLNVTVASWKLIMQTSSIFVIPKTTQKVVFLSILPDWYRSSITNCPSWFQIGPNFSSVNHIRAEISRLKRLDINKEIAAFVLLIQEDSHSEVYAEFFQIEHIHVFITPMPRTTVNVSIHDSIYGRKTLIARYKGESNVLSLDFDVDQNGDVELLKWKQISLDHTVISDYNLQVPQFFNELRQNYNPTGDPAVRMELSRALSDIYGEQYTGDLVDPRTGWTPESYGCRTATCPMGLLASASLLSSSDGASIAILNSGAIRGSWNADKPEINLADILRVFPFHNKLVSFNVTGATVYRILAHSISYGLSSRLAQTNLRWVYFPYYDAPPSSGAPIEDALSHIMDVALQKNDGTFEDIDLKKSYRIVTLSYLTEGNDGYERVLDSNTMSDASYHTDTLLTSVVHYLRKSKFTWTISKESMSNCLFNRNLTPLPLVNSTCLMAFSNVTAAQYKPCPTSQDFCRQQQSFQPQPLIVQSMANISYGQIDEHNEHNNSHLEETQADLDTQGITYSITYDPHTNQLSSSPHDYYTSTYFPHLYAREQEKLNQSKQDNFFYLQIPFDDQNSLLSSQTIPKTILPKRYFTAYTGWADEMINSGEIQFLNSDGTIAETPVSPFFTAAREPAFPIELVPGVYFDPELPLVTDCAACSGYGTCSSEAVCDCTLGGETEEERTLYQGKPTKGLYKGIEMISGISCSTVLTRYVRSSVVVVLIHIIAVVTLLISIASLIFLIVYRKHPVIKSSGFEMLAVMCIGGAIVALGLQLLIYSPLSELQRQYLKNESAINKSIVLGFSTKLRLWFSPISLCNFTLSLTLIGFIIMFGAILTKSYRIHCIFNARSLHEIQQFSNFRTRALLSTLVAFQLLFLLLVYFISPMNAVASKSDDQFWVDCNIPDLRYQRNNVADDSPQTQTKLTPRLITYIFLSFYNCLVLCLGVYLSLVTRNVERKYNESSVLAISVYNLVFCAVIFFLALATNNPAASKLLQVGILAYGVASTLLLMLLPKVKVIYSDRKKTGQGGEDDAQNKVYFYDPVTLRIQALEREQRFESQEKLENTITTQQAHLATLIQHILANKDGFSPNVELTSPAEQSSDNDDDDNGNETGSETHPLAQNKPRKNNTSKAYKSKAVYTISPDIEQILSQYQSNTDSLQTNESKDSIRDTIHSRGSLNTSASSLSTASIANSTLSTTPSVDEQRRTRLFGHMAKSRGSIRPTPTSSSIVSPAYTPSTSTTVTSNTDLQDLQLQPSSNHNQDSVLL